jgi:hypothetical protein
MLGHFAGVMAGLGKKDVDARDNPGIKSRDGHDGGEAIRSQVLTPDDD